MDTPSPHTVAWGAVLLTAHGKPQERNAEANRLNGDARRFILGAGAAARL
jgi:hypothetical protein